MQTERASGVLLHPTSLPSRYGIGELGGSIFTWLDFLAQSGQKLWQILPLSPTGYGESPYQSFSAFAGNPLLISIDALLTQNLLAASDIFPLPPFPAETVDYPAVREYKDRLLRRAFSNFRKVPRPNQYQAFIEKHFFWLHDFAFFMALRDFFAFLPWNRWDKGIARRKKEALGYFENLLAEEIEYQYFLQYLFFSQWAGVKEYAREKGIIIIGDLPIFVSADSADTWVNPHLFAIDEEGYPEKLAGVPPDYFSETGQLWGNPLYRWDKMAEDDYFWWRERFRTITDLVDVVRLDHFRGFEACWEVPGGEKTAVNGRWVKGPGHAFFATLREHLGELPIIAEDLGYITPEVKELRDAFAFPGMKVLQFTYREELDRAKENKNMVFYTGTHDNDTLLGWYKKFVLGGLSAKTKETCPEQVCWDFIRLVLQSPANWVIFPLQDILCLDSPARMNTPGTVGGSNWRWRFRKEDLTPKVMERLRCLSMEAAR